jgi:hypothetical protein
MMRRITLGVNQIFPLELMSIDKDILTFKHGYHEGVFITVSKSIILDDNLPLAHSPDQVEEWKDKGTNSLCMELSSHARFSPQTGEIETEYQHVRLFEVRAWA